METAHTEKSKPFDANRPVTLEEKYSALVEYLDTLHFIQEPQEVIATSASWFRAQVGLPYIDPLVFPDIINGVAGDFSKVYSSVLEVPEHFLFMAYLACLGNTLAKTLTLNTELDIQPRLYLLLLGESADERKSTTLKKVTEFYREILKFDFGVTWGVNSDAGLQKLFKRNDSLIMVIDELRQLVGKCKIEGSTLLPMITTLFESNIYEAHTKTSDILIENASLSLLAASTIETLEKIWDSSFTAIGFNNRLFLVPGSARRRFSFPVKVSEGDKARVKEQTIKILQHVGDGLELDITPQGKDLFQKWYMTLSRSVHAKRLDGYALRLMALLAVNEFKTEIDVDIVTKVLMLCDWQLEVRKAYDPIDADNSIAEMEEKIRRNLAERGALTERDLRRNLARIINRSGMWCFSTALNNLRKGKDIYYKKNEKTLFIYLSE